jgi:aryl-alcohol dehydrogenase-like predicted oxidoreductase
VIIKEAVANGRLTDRNTSDEASRLKRYADAHHTSPDVMALAAALSNTWVDVVLSGAVTVDQLASNLRATALAETTDWPDIAEPAHEYWTRRGALSWR